MKAEQASGTLPNPAFGKADLSNCETEQIHLAGAIQPHGALLVAEADTLEIIQASTNAAGYDRVMVYRFDENGHGEVFAESREPQLEPFLGNRYPASDIPHIARRLYERNRIRLLSDVNSTQIPLQPQLCPLTGQDLDMSLCTLRSMSPTSRHRKPPSRPDIVSRSA